MTIQRKLLYVASATIIYASIELWRWSRYRYRYEMSKLNKAIKEEIYEKINEEINEKILMWYKRDMAERRKVAERREVAERKEVAERSEVADWSDVAERRDIAESSEMLVNLYRDIPVGPMRHYRAIGRLLDSARQSINICMYIFTSDYLSSALIRAHKRGVIVRLIIEESIESSSNSQIKQLLQQKIPVRVESRHTMHHKFLLIDVPHEFNDSQVAMDMEELPFYLPYSGLLLTDSLNYTMEAFTNNQVNFILTSNQQRISDYMDHFLEMWVELF